MLRLYKALIMNAAFGHGSESTVDVAAGVDLGVMMGIVMALGQVGKHLIKDGVGNYVVDPVKEMFVGKATDAVTEEDDEDDDGGGTLEAAGEFIGGFFSDD